MNHVRVRAGRRPRSTPQERTDWVRRYSRSELSQREFAEQHRLGLSTLRKWIAENPVAASAGSAGSPGWQELKLPASPWSTGWAAELVRPDGLVLRLTPSAPPEWVAQLLRIGSC